MLLARKRKKKLIKLHSGKIDPSGKNGISAKDGMRRKNRIKEENQNVLLYLLIKTKYVISFILKDIYRKFEGTVNY